MNYYNEEPERHKCQSHKEGDWIIFTCNQCKTYERRINWKTGKMKTRSDNFEIIHEGFHTPALFSTNMSSNN